MWLRRFLCVIQAFARFICDENAVRKRRNGDAKMAKLWCIAANAVAVSCISVANAAVGGAEMAVGGVVAGFSCLVSL